MVLYFGGKRTTTIVVLVPVEVFETTVAVHQVHVGTPERTTLETFERHFFFYAQMKSRDKT
jgi:hypothetical protein